MSDKILYGYLSLFFVALSGLPYIFSVWAGKTRPHLFTWIIWTLVTAIAAAAQYAGHAGPGAWAATLSALFCLATTLLAITHGERTITFTDWIAFIVGLSAIPLWYFTDNPLTAVLIATLIDLAAYYPTFRKSYIRPQEEMIFSYAVSNVKHIASIAALAVYSLTTVFYPAVLLAANTALIIMLVWRRREIMSNIYRH
jgi:hypothetical protein